MAPQFKSDLAQLLEQADDDMLWLVYCLLLKVSKSSYTESKAPTHSSAVFLEKLKKVQQAKPFQQIQDSVAWQKQQRDEWE